MSLQPAAIRKLQLAATRLLPQIHLDRRCRLQLLVRYLVHYTASVFTLAVEAICLKLSHEKVSGQPDGPPNLIPQYCEFCVSVASVPQIFPRIFFKSLEENKICVIIICGLKTGVLRGSFVNFLTYYKNSCVLAS